jgi:glycosyltransferase involved in cell wall biosynthesis
MEKGVGGSEEAVINLSKELAKKGWNVTVYNNCGHGGVFDGVTYKPFWSYNYRDKQDVTIFWRHPKPVDYVGDWAGKIFIDLHDVVPQGEFTDERLKKIEKIMVKTKAHRVLFPNVPDEKFSIIPNGIDPSLFEKKVEKNPYLILNTSSADRHLDATLDVFEELIERQPEKPWKLAWYYGWGVYDSVHEGNKEMMEWKKKQMERFEKLVKEGRAEGGTMLGHKEIAEKYLEAGIFLYPTQFYEIFCISAVKARLAKCLIIASDFAALKETITGGARIHTSGNRWGAENTFGDDENIEAYVNAIADSAKVINDENMYDSEVAKNEYHWLNVSNQWNENICD